MICFEDFIKKRLLNENCSIQEASILNFWHSSVLNAKGFPISGGFSLNRLLARKIAVSEFIERHHFLKIKASSQSLQNEWGLNQFPTACGFCSGFNKKNTILRSIQEATERWVMSQWIDNHFFIEEIDEKIVRSQLSQASLFFLSQFDQVLFFRKFVDVPFDNQVFKITVAQTMGIQGDGIFPGSSTRENNGDLWEHALLESYRHLIGTRNNPIRSNQFPDSRIYFFANNKALALKEIYKEKKTIWPEPKIHLHKAVDLYGGHAFLARTILKGWKSWHEGPVDRFLY